jgi:hypothetical protein
MFDDDDMYSDDNSDSPFNDEEENKENQPIVTLEQTHNDNEIPDEYTISVDNAPQHVEDFIDKTSSQNKLWNNMCPYDTFPVVTFNKTLPQSGLITVQKDCRRCLKSFLLNINTAKFEEIPYE